MKRNRSVTGVLMLLTLLVSLQTSAQTTSSREQLQQLTAQLQKNPGDSALREKLIKLALTIKPTPAVPEEANRANVKGAVFLREAKDSAGYELAMATFQQAMHLAPWWGSPYYNLAVTQELAGKYDEAIASLKFYLLAEPVGNDAVEARNRMYAIEAKKEITQKLEPAAPNLSGVWTKFIAHNAVGEYVGQIAKYPSGNRYADYRIESKGGGRFALYELRRDGAPYVGPVPLKYEFEIKDGTISGTYHYFSNFCGKSDNPLTGNIVDNGNQLLFKLEYKEKDYATEVCKQIRDDLGESIVRLK